MRDGTWIYFAAGAIALSLAACQNDVANTSAGFGSGDATSGGETSTSGGGDEAGADETATGAGGEGDGTSTGAGEGGNDDGGVQGDVCMGAQSGLCEEPGVTMHCYSGDPVTCNVGECAGGTQSCEVIDLDLGEWTECTGETLPSLEVCDGLDNDCDGDTDEDTGETVCGLGACQHAVPDCVGGRAGECDPFDGATAERCDGADNDCDGDIDEDFAGRSVSCGVGQCEHSVVACMAGQPVMCDPLENASAETCDGVDNDCDGMTDEDFGTLSCGVGECAHDVDECIAGVPQVCDPWQGMGPETCDGLDNDCDGMTDEGFGAVNCGVGACQHLVEQCLGGMPEVCDPFDGAVPEVCADGIDNDCDGATDENCGCGNGVINVGEECDAPSLGGQSCLSLGHDGGTLACNPDCTFDESGCYVCNPVGPGLVDPAGPIAGGPGGCNPIVAELTCSSTYVGQVLPGSSSLDGPYSCGVPYAGLNQPEGEDVYSFACQADGVVDLEISGMDCDLDIYVLESNCNTGAGCLDGSTAANTANDSVSFLCVAGQTYYIVIEGYGWQNIFPPAGQCNPGEGNYTLSFQTGNAVGGCLEDCDDGVDNDLDGDVDCNDADCMGDPVCDPCPGMP